MTNLGGGKFGRWGGGGKGNGVETVVSGCGVKDDVTSHLPIIEDRLQHKYGDAWEEVGNIELQQDSRSIDFTVLTQQRGYRGPGELVRDLQLHRCLLLI